MAEKLTAVMETALSTIGARDFIGVTMWGGKPFTSLPAGCGTMATLEALERRRLLWRGHAGTRQIYRLTEKGRAALALSKKDETNG